MKSIFALLFLLIVPSAFAGPYVEYKNELKYKDTNFRKDIHHFRLGYKTEKNFYFEAGPRSNGAAAVVDDGRRVVVAGILVQAPAGKTGEEIT